jgi:hypothetical protein
VLAVLGCSDGKLNFLLVFWGDHEESSSSRERIQKEPKSSSSAPILSSSSIIIINSSSSISSSSVDSSSDSSSSEEMPSYSSAEEPPVLSSSSSSKGVRSSSSKTDSNGNTYVDYPTLNEGAAGVQKGWASRYWDGCKQDCSWLHKNKGIKPFRICKNCDKTNKEISTYFKRPDWSEWFTGYDGVESSCTGGKAYACWDMAPIAINDTLAYGFAAVNPDVIECGACYQLEFDGNWHSNPNPRPTNRAIKGKTMIVMASNIGGVELNQFDIMIPGGGTGDFDSFSNQLGIKNTDWKMGQEDVTFGGLLTNCLYDGINMVLGLNGANAIRDGSHRANLEQWQECLRIGCKRIFSNKAKELYDGCLWHVDWFMAADNPTLYYKKVDCPKYLIDKYTSSIDTEPPALPENPNVPCLINGNDCRQMGWW